MKPLERANIIIGRLDTAIRCGNPFGEITRKFVADQIIEATYDDWEETLRGKCRSTEQRALVDALIASLEIAMQETPRHEERVRRVREIIKPQVVKQKEEGSGE